MATALTERLTRAHDAQQKQLAAQLAALLERQWASTVKRPYDGTDQFLEQALRSIRTQFQASATLSKGFYAQARLLEHPGVPSLPAAPLPEFVEEAVVASIVAAGFDELTEALKRGDTLEQALERGSTSVRGAGVRHALNGGRRAIIDASQRDRLDVAYARVPQSGCCSFCAVLASRGAVYRDDSFDESDPRFIGPGEVKVHDACRCEFRPIWHRRDGVPSINREFADLWAAVKIANPGATGKAALNAFRREYEAIYKPAQVASGTAASRDAA